MEKCQQANDYLAKQQTTNSRSILHKKSVTRLCPNWCRSVFGWVAER